MPFYTTIANLTGDMKRDDPEKDVVTLETIDTQSSRGGAFNAGVRIKDWLSYRFNSHFTTPTDGWSFSIAADELSPTERTAIRPGAEIKLTVGEHAQLTGYIDQITYTASRGGGLVWNIEGRDKLGPAVDSNADPTVQFKAGRSLLDFLAEVFKPFGYGVEAGFDPSNATNRDVMTGKGGANLTGKKGTELVGKERSISKKGRLLKDFKLHQLRPHANEGCFAFASRVTNRFGLRIWLRADGTKIVVGEPDYGQTPLYSLVRRRNGQGANIIDGTVSRNLSEQPSAIVADGFSGGGEFGKGKIIAVMLNPAVDSPDAAAFVSKWKKRGAKVIEPLYTGPKMKTKVSKPAYLHDDEAKTQEELDNFIIREMSHRLQKSLTAHYTFEGHSLNGSVVAVDTMVKVVDEAADLEENLWVLSRTFNKSRTGGTTTEVELIRPFSLEF